MNENIMLHQFFRSKITQEVLQVVAEYNLYKSYSVLLVLVNVATNEKWLTHKNDFFVFFEHVGLEDAIALLPKKKPRKTRRKRCSYCKELKDNLIDMIDQDDMVPSKCCKECWNEMFDPIEEPGGYFITPPVDITDENNKIPFST